MKYLIRLLFVLIFIALFLFIQTASAQELTVMCFDGADLVSELPMDEATSDLLLELTQPFPENPIIFTGMPYIKGVHTVYHVDVPDGEWFIYTHNMGEGLVGVTVQLTPLSAVFFIAHGFDGLDTNPCLHKGEVNA